MISFKVGDTKTQIKKVQGQKKKKIKAQKRPKKNTECPRESKRQGKQALTSETDKKETKKNQR